MALISSLRIESSFKVKQNVDNVVCSVRLKMD